MTARKSWTMLKTCLKANQVTICNRMNYKHKSGTPIKDHMLIVIGYLAKTQSHGSKIDADT